MKTLTFQSKVDTWLGAVLVLGAGSTLWGSVHTGQWLPIALTVAVFGLLVFPMRYELHEDALVVRAGLIRYRRPYAAITGAIPNHNLLSAPALSIDRLLITSKGGLGVNISPADRDAFLAALAARAPHLIAIEGGLVS